MAWTKISKFAKRSFKKGSSRRGGRRRNKLSKGMKRSVTSLIRREEETKCQQHTSSVSLGSYGSNYQANGFIPLTPYGTYVAIPQGTGEGDRVGNKLRIVKATFSYVIRPNPYNGSTNILPLPQEVVVRIMAVKNSNILAAAAGNYFQAGNGSTNPTGNLLDIPRVVNNDLYSQYRMVRHKLGYGSFTPIPGATTAQGNFVNNDFALNVVKTIDYTKYCPKIIRFNDNTSTPINRVLQTFIESVNADGSTSSVTQTPATMDYTISIWYKDA